MLEKLYKYLIMIYFDFVRDPVLALTRRRGEKEKALILDLDWYRWCLTETEVLKNLHAHPELSKYADFMRIERSQLFKTGTPFLEANSTSYKEISHDGFNLWGICKATVISNLGEIKINPNDASHMGEIQRVYGEAASGIDKLKKLFSRLRPHAVFVCQGGVFDSRCVIEVARRLGITVVGVENSMIGGLVILDNLSGLIVNRHSLARTGSELLETWQVTLEERSSTFDIWRDKLSQKAEEHRTGGVDDPVQMRKELNIPRGHKVILLLAQVRTDASIVLDSGLYEDPVDMIEEVAKHVSGLKDTVLLVRLHPKELMGKAINGTPYDRMTYRLLKERGIDALSNVKIIEDAKYNTYTLMDIADSGVTINSQAGLEMCLLGKPVMVCGDAFYGNKGFTVDLGSAAALGSTLDFLVNEAVMTPMKHRRALDFMHFFYKRYLFDHGLSKNNKRLFELFRLDAETMERQEKCQ